MFSVVTESSQGSFLMDCKCTMRDPDAPSHGKGKPPCDGKEASLRLPWRSRG
jgi:hypothetical protein